MMVRLPPFGMASRALVARFVIAASSCMGSTTTGQIVLVVIAGLFAVGFGTMNRLSRPQPSPRLFVSPEQPS